MKKYFGMLALIMVSAAMLPKTGSAAVAVDPRLKKLETPFEDARDHFREGKLDKAHQDIQKAIVYFEGLHETIDGRARKLIRNSIVEMERLQTQIQGEPAAARTHLLPVYENAVSALLEHIRKPYGNPTGKLIPRQDVALIKEKLVQDFLKG
ncbi:MAG TPA: hypothetical protein VL688_03515 [Verrucomicrobiae bacterium]|jgi:hypothetical protein|nr:hypothetical protein [Verrucomicrobiae bacterium]